MQVSEQVNDQSDRRPHLWRAGQSGNVRGKALMQDRARQAELERQAEAAALIAGLGRRPKADVVRHGRDVRSVPCVDGSELARRIFTSQGLVGAAMCSAC